MDFWEVVIFTAWDEPRGAVYFSKEEEAQNFYKAFNDRYWWKLEGNDEDSDAYAKIYHHMLDKYNLNNIREANIIF